MKNTIIAAALAAGASLAMSVAALAGEYDNKCTMGLALSKDVATDCKINLVIKGKTYCFGNEDAKALFLEDTKGNLEKAAAYVASSAKK